MYSKYFKSSSSLNLNMWGFWGLSIKKKKKKKNEEQNS
jgi:hypothetical protein